MATLDSYAGSYYISYTQLTKAVEEIRDLFIDWNKKLSKAKTKKTEPTYSFEKQLAKLIEIHTIISSYKITDKDVLEFLSSATNEHIEVRIIRIENLEEDTRLDHLPLITMDASLRPASISIINDSKLNSLLQYNRNVYHLIQNLHDLVLFYPKYAYDKDFTYAEFLKKYTKYPSINLVAAKTPAAEKAKDFDQQIDRAQHKPRRTVAKESKAANKISTVKKWIDSYGTQKHDTSDKIYKELISMYPDDRIDMVLDKLGLKTLFLDLLECLKPSDWLQLLCENAIKKIGVVNLLETFAQSGILQELQAVSDEFAQVTGDLLERKQLRKKDIARLEKEKDEIDTVLALMDKIQEMQAVSDGAKKKADKAEAKGKKKAAKTAKKADTLTLEDFVEEEQPTYDELKQSVGEVYMRGDSSKLEAASIKVHIGTKPDLLARRVLIDLEIQKLKVFNNPLSEETLFATDKTFNDVSQEFQSLLLGLEDPELRSKICDSIISGVPELRNLSIPDIPDKFDYNVSPPEVVRPTMPKLPKLPTDDIYDYIYNLVKMAVLAALAALIVNIVEDLLSELLSICKDLKGGLIDALKDDVLSSPTGNTDDVFPDGLDDVAPHVGVDADLIEDFVGDLALILSPLELCALLRGELNRTGRKIVIKMLELKHPVLLAKLENADEIFVLFEALGELTGSFCDDLFDDITERTRSRRTPDVNIQDLCTEPPKAAEDLRCKLLEDILTNEECKEELAALEEAKQDLVERILSALTDPGSIFDKLKDDFENPACGDDPILPDVDEDGFIRPHAALLDLTVRTALEPVEASYVSDIRTFKNQLRLIEVGDGITNLVLNNTPKGPSKKDSKKETIAENLMTKIHTVNLKQPVSVINASDHVTTHAISRGNLGQRTVTQNKVINLLNGNILYYVGAATGAENFKMVIEISPNRDIVAVQYDDVASVYSQRASDDIINGLIPPKTEYLKTFDSIFADRPNILKLSDNVKRELYNALRRNIHGSLLADKSKIITGEAITEITELLIPKTVWNEAEGEECKTPDKQKNQTLLQIQDAVEGAKKDACAKPDMASKDNKRYENAVEKQYVQIMIRLYIVDFILRALPIIKLVYAENTFVNQYVAAAIAGYMRRDIINRGKKEVYTNKTDLTKKTYFTEVVRVLREDEDESRESMDILREKIMIELEDINSELAVIIFEAENTPQLAQPDQMFEDAALSLFKEIPMIMPEARTYYDYKIGYTQSATAANGAHEEIANVLRIKKNQTLELYKTSVGNTSISGDEYGYNNMNTSDILKDENKILEEFEFYTKFNSLFLGASFGYQIFLRGIREDNTARYMPKTAVAYSELEDDETVVSIEQGARLVMLVLDDKISEHTIAFMDAAIQDVNSTDSDLSVGKIIDAKSPSGLPNVPLDGVVFVQPIVERTIPVSSFDNAVSIDNQLMARVLLTSDDVKKLFYKSDFIDIELIWFMHLLNVYEFVGDEMQLYDRVFENTKQFAMESFFAIINSGDLINNEASGESLLTQLQAVEDEVTNFIAGLQPDVEGMYLETPFLIMKGIADLVDPLWKGTPLTLFGIVASLWNGKNEEDKATTSDKKQVLNCKPSKETN